MPIQSLSRYSPMPMPMPSLCSHSRLRSMPISSYSSLSPHSPLRILCSRSVIPPQTRSTDGQLILRSIPAPSKKEVIDSPGLIAVPSKKVYIVSTSSYGVFGDNPGSPMNIFCVDLQSEPKSKGLSFLRPKVRLCDRAFNGAAFCIFESTLYVFQGYDSKSIYSYKLEADFSNLNLEKRMMEKVGCMKTLKHSPTAVPTPDGKNILVFSCSNTPGCNFDFELFNPETGSCEKLPHISCAENFVWIDSYTFLNNYTLLVQVKQRYWKRSYILDFRSPSWKNCLGSFNASLHFNFLILGNEVCLTRGAGYHIDIGNTSINESSSRCYLFPETSSLPDDFVPRFITLIAGEDENGVCEFCILSVNVRGDEDEHGFKYIPHIILDVYRCDVNVCKEGMKRINELKKGEEEWKCFTLPGAKKIKSLKFRTLEDYGFNVVSCEPLKFIFS